MGIAYCIIHELAKNRLKVTRIRIDLAKLSNSVFDQENLCFSCTLRIEQEGFVDSIGN
jgi:hypothetical protein